MARAESVPRACIYCTEVLAEGLMMSPCVACHPAMLAHTLAGLSSPLEKRKFFSHVQAL